MPTTPTNALPYPDPTVTPDVPYDMQRLAEAVEAGLGPAWQTWTPVLTATTTNPSLGSGAVLTGRYQVAARRLTGVLRTLLGTGATLGSGTWTYTLPVAVGTSAVAGVVGWGRYRTNAGAYVFAQLEAAPGSSTATVLVHQPGGATPNLSRHTHLVPTGQVAGDSWEFRLDYEVN